PLSDTQIGLLDELANPHGLTKFGSVTGASPGRSETKLLTIYSAPAGTGAKTKQTPPSMAQESEAAKFFRMNVFIGGCSSERPCSRRRVLTDKAPSAGEGRTGCAQKQRLVG